MDATPTLNRGTRLAAIDAGSNGIRMIIGELRDDGSLVVIQNVRQAVRMGNDTFSQGTLTDQTLDAVADAFTKFADLIHDLKVQRVRAVATSAAREATNRDALIDRVKSCSGINLKIISGLEEAQLVFTAVADHMDVTGKNVILVDMGGGSVEVTFARNGLAVGCETFRLGPVRLLTRLQQLDQPESAVEAMIDHYRGTLKGLIKVELENQPPQECIGIGGNIECLGKLRGQLLGKVKNHKVDLTELDKMADALLAMPVAQRIKKFDLRPDRADVIAIAAIVMRMIMRDAGLTRLFIPGVSLKEGLLRQLARDATGS